MTRALDSVVEQIRQGVARTIVGQAESVDLMLVALLCSGHALVEGVPGLGKTLAVRTLARLLRLRFQRVQCTPDLMPADILGSNVYNLSTSTFTLHNGPIFADLVVVDEINRMPPRTQAALLEAMEERQVTIDGTSHRLSSDFAVFATQNPVEFEGTYPLPEAELDRFLLKIRFAYPDHARQEEEAILLQHHQGFDPRSADTLDVSPIDADQLALARREVASVQVEPPLFQYVAAIARRTRDWPSIALGMSPRASVHLLQVSKALAALAGRDYLLPDDVKRASGPVCRHRLVLNADAELDAVVPDQAIADVLAAVEVPR
jgi:MoxR-like ATPase